MTYYIAILVASENGRWHVLFPDVPQCESHGDSPATLRRAAADTLKQFSRAKRISLNPPRTLQEIERDTDWLDQHRVNLDEAIVTIVPWPDDPFSEIGGHA
jgi:predicted RNase H-like HicB family nuclease